MKRTHNQYTTIATKGNLIFGNMNDDERSFFFFFLLLLFDVRVDWNQGFCGRKCCNLNLWQTNFHRQMYHLISFWFISCVIGKIGSHSLIVISSKWIFYDIKNISIRSFSKHITFPLTLFISWFVIENLSIEWIQRSGTAIVGLTITLFLLVIFIMIFRYHSTLSIPFIPNG